MVYLRRFRRILVHDSERQPLLALDQKGILVLFEAFPEAFKPLDRREISPKDTTWAYNGLDGNRVLIRSFKGVSVWEWKRHDCGLAAVERVTMDTSEAGFR